MTEGEWLTCADPTPMMEFLKGKVSDRRLRLFACACCRRIWPSLKKRGSQNAVEVCETYADQRCTEEKLKSACWKAQEAFDKVQWAAESDVETTPAKAAMRLGCEADFNAPWAVDWAAATFGVRAREKEYQRRMKKCSRLGQVAEWEQYDSVYAAGRSAEELVQASILRDVIFNPFRPISINSIWLTPTVTGLATIAYDERALPSGELDIARLAVLSDALEEAGCDDADILAHLRSPGPHVRGCWVLDLLLGKE